MKSDFSAKTAVAGLRRHGSVLAGVALIGALAVGTAIITGGTPPATAASPVRSVPAVSAPIDFSAVIERVSPAVVNVQVEGHVPAAMAGTEMPELPKGMEEFFRRFFGDEWDQKQMRPQRPSRGPVMRGLGSGFIIDPSGLIVTNNHVVGEAEKITVTLQNQRTFKAKLIGTDPETDLALIKIDNGGDLPYVSFSTRPTPRPGEWVIAVGNPFGLDHTATAGIVSATGRAIGAGPYDDFIQIDAPINKGNSGGPTFNLAGEVVGVNTAIFSPTGGSVGIGFAIPASTARDVIAQLKAHGSVKRGWLGVEVQKVTPDIAEGLGLDQPHGALVSSLVKGGPAAKAGLRSGDLIVAVDGRKIERMRTLPRMIAAIRPDHKAALDVLRGGKRMTINVVIGTRPAPEKLASAGKTEGATSGAVLGMRLAPTDDGVAVVAVDPDGEAARRGVAEGDVIVSVANDRVRAPRDVVREVESARKAGRKSVLMLMARNGAQRFVAIPVPKA